VGAAAEDVAEAGPGRLERGGVVGGGGQLGAVRLGVEDGDPGGQVRAQ
jgi:hypothetical protein